MTNITTSGTYRFTSNWQVPQQGTPTFVPDGSLNATHFAGMGFAQVWSAKSAFCDHTVDAKLNVLSGSYWNPALREPIVVLPWADLPTVIDTTKPGGRAVWPLPPFQAKGVGDLKIVLILEGDFPSTVLEAFDCPNLVLDVYHVGSAAWLWTMKGAVSLERCTSATVRHHTGTSMSTCAVRTLASPYPHVEIGSSVVCKGRNLDSGMHYTNARYRKPDSTIDYTACGGSTDCKGVFDIDLAADMLGRLQTPFDRAHAMADDWWRGGEFFAESVYCCAPNGGECDVLYLDPREGWMKRPGQSVKGLIMGAKQVVVL